MTQDFQKALNMAVYYLGRQARTQFQMLTYLTKKGFEEEIIAQVMEKLIEYNYINDLEYARRFVEINAKNQGVYLLRQKLKLKGVGSADVDLVLSELDNQEQLQAAKDFIEKKMRFEERDDGLQRAMRSCMQRGFSYDIVKKAASAYKEELEWTE